MIYYAVLDTNVLVSAMLKGTSIPGVIVDQSLNGKIIPLLNSEIILEYKEVLSREKFHFQHQDVDELIFQLSRRAVFLDRTNSSESFPDPDDIVFYEITLSARKDSDAWLVTGNKKHYPAKPFVVSPREMLDIIEEE
ncbi:MAG: putative toxin-antitoxin system toxin component, PIN family [Flexilinea sp.]|nr:putative toxin-antitoxin system toxin component, PIN family [Flexilinea sp.]